MGVIHCTMLSWEAGFNSSANLTRATSGGGGGGILHKTDAALDNWEFKLADDGLATAGRDGGGKASPEERRASLSMRLASLLDLREPSFLLRPLMQ